ncbi:MAG: hypothetical protein Q7T07_01390 [Burkholderiaceae bacterium]|nr:hypothetical protein [Burkholderiaceae bacterium]
MLDWLPAPAPVTDAAANHGVWAQWQRGLKNRITLPALLPRLRLLLVWDNLKGHLTPALVLWLFAHGVMPPYTPLSGSWLNMAESIQRIIGRRALAGQYLQTWVPLKVQCPGWRLHCATSATPLRFPPSKKYANACGKRLVVQLV